ncbi:hypothetical protein WJX73_000862 [Symbiochloris irregularis]|uniref:Uncharacterized protein n=1 Tax=Symbiochloris irregularis TaxID=706552 RepID=A0AAW1PPY0_9CHLO
MFRFLKLPCVKQVLGLAAVLTYVWICELVPKGFHALALVLAQAFYLSSTLLYGAGAYLGGCASLTIGAAAQLAVTVYSHALHYAVAVPSALIAMTISASQQVWAAVGNMVLSGLLFAVVGTIGILIWRLKASHKSLDVEKQAHAQTRLELMEAVHRQAEHKAALKTAQEDLAAHRKRQRTIMDL